MMYKLIYTNKAAKQVRTLDKPIKKIMKEHLEFIALNPYVGHKKKGKLNDVWGYGFNLKGVSYRIAYSIYNDELVVLIIAAGTHEGFWEEVSRYL
jgi:mRNA-degrading endonuclease RelE of RelBE toxin-antitoxin system